MSTEQTQFKEIDGVNYACEMMPAILANKVLVKLIDLAGRPALVMAAEAFDEVESSPGETGTLDLGAIARLGVEQVFMKLTPDEATLVLLAVMQGVRYEGCPSDKDLNDEKIFNTHFRGKLLSAYKVWAWSMRCNYQDFLDAARSNGVISGLIEKGGAALSKVSTLTSESPASAMTEKADSL